MNNKGQRGILTKVLILVVLFFGVFTVSTSFAQEMSSEEIAALKSQVQQLLKRIEVLEEEQAKIKEVAVQKVSTPSADRGGQVSLFGEKNLFDQLPDYLTRGFGFSGYFRSGFGINSKGGKMEAFQAPDTLSKYRLGNEQDTYLETVFTEKNWNPDPNGIRILSQIRLSYQTQQNQSWDEQNKVVLREAYGEMGNFIENDPNVKVWAGQRFYRLPPLEIVDFFWSDMSGYGGGVEDINFFNLGKLNVAYIGYADTDVTLATNHGRIAKNNLHFMLDEVNVPGGKGSFWVNAGYVRQGTFSGITYPNAGGVDLGFMHQAKGKNSDNQFGLQYGYGANTSLSTGAIELPLVGSDRESWRFRLTDMYNKKFNDRLSLQAVGVYQYTDNGKSKNSQENWWSFGLRPVYGLSKYLALEVEPGVDYVDNQQDGYGSYLFKFTTALRLSPNAAFDSHPRFRLFATYAHWGDNFKGHAGGGEAYTNNNDGLNFGVQCEQWW
jgi:maltoporin